MLRWRQFRPPRIRSFHRTARALNNNIKYEFYDKEKISEQPPMKEDKEVVNSLVFDTNTPSTQKMDLQDIFGSGDKKQTVSSRMDLSYRAVAKDICGVEVPKRPIEPTNCCGSGCVNCVWVIFDDDMEDWKEATKEAVELLMEQDTSTGDFEKWPLGFDPPPKGLDPVFIPDELKVKEENEDVENKMPIAFSVFTDFERNLKKKKSNQGVTDLRAAPASSFEKKNPEH